MDLKEIQLLVKITSSVITTFTTEQNLKKISQIRQNIEDISEDTIQFAQELLKDSAATAKIVEQLFLDVMITAGLDAPMAKSRSVNKTVVKGLRKEIQRQFSEQRYPTEQYEEHGKTTVDK